MALARAVDSLDVYIRWSRRRPELIQNEGLQHQIDGAGRSVALKFKAMTSYHGGLPAVPVSMVLLMIAWRNRAVHEEADTEINTESREILLKAGGEISEKYRGLSVEKMLDGFENSTPSFKEIASLIQATGEFIRELEAAQFRNLNTEQYLRNLISEDIKSPQSNQASRQREMKQRIQSVWGKDSKERAAIVSRYLQHCGLSLTSKYDYSVIFDDSFLEKIFRMRPGEVWEWLSA